MVFLKPTPCFFLRIKKFKGAIIFKQRGHNKSMMPILLIFVVLRAMILNTPTGSPGGFPIISLDILGRWGKIFAGKVVNMEDIRVENG